MLATNAEISASATTPAETVIARNAKDGTEKIGYKHGKPNCFLCLIFMWFLLYLLSLNQRRQQCSEYEDENLIPDPMYVKSE